MNNPFSDLNNKTVIITGGLGFMAKQYTSVFVSYGCKVILLDIKKKYQNQKKILLTSNAILQMKMKFRKH